MTFLEAYGIGLLALLGIKLLLWLASTAPLAYNPWMRLLEAPRREMSAGNSVGVQ